MRFRDTVTAMDLIPPILVVLAVIALVFAGIAFDKTTDTKQLTDITLYPSSGPYEDGLILTNSSGLTVRIRMPIFYRPANSLYEFWYSNHIYVTNLKSVSVP